MNNAVHRALLVKQEGWKYEQEHRILYEQDGDGEPRYCYFGPNDLAAVIVGHCMDPELSELVERVCGRLGIPVYTTLIRNMSNRVEIVPADFRVEYAGETIDEQLQRFYENNPVRPFPKSKAGGASAKCAD